MRVLKAPIDKVKNVWEDLIKKSASKNPFVDYPWLSTIHLHPDVNRCMVYIGYDANEPLIGIPILAPKYKGDYSDILMESDLDSDLVYKLVAIILKESITTDFPQGSFFKYDSEFVKENKSMVSLDTKKGTWDIPLPEKYEDYWEAFKGKKRYNIRRDLKLLQENHKVEIQVKASRKYMKDFFELHEKKWGPRWSTGAMRIFLEAYAKALGNKLWLGMMKIDDKPAYMIFCTECENKLYVNIGGYDEKYRKYGIGILTHLAMIEAAISSGITEYDMMKGDSAYKQTLGGIKRERYYLRRDVYA